MAEEPGYASCSATRSSQSEKPLGNAPRLQPLLAIEDRLFTEQRLKFYGSGLLVGLTIAVICCWARGIGDWVVRPDGRLGNIDFCWIWVSGKFAATSAPSRIYDHALYQAAFQNFYQRGECHLLLEQYIYPPTFLFFTYMLGLMPYLAAYAVWIGATLFIYLAAVTLIVPGWTAVIVALTPLAVPLNITLGHNGFLSAGLIGLSLSLLERRPWLAGILLGLLTCKPQYGVLFPLALLAARNWRAIGSAAATGLALGATAAMAFGPQTWPAFVASLFDRTSGLSPQPGVELVLDTVYGLLYRAGADARLAWAVQLAVALSLAPAVYYVWAKPIPYALKAAMLSIASLLATPYVLHYDLCILSITTAFLVKDGLSRGFLAGERMIIVACFVILYFLRVPLAPIIYLILLLLIYRRVAVANTELPAIPPKEPFASTLTAGSRR
jgi:hypothetical protein